MKAKFNLKAAAIILCIIAGLFVVFALVSSSQNSVSIEKNSTIQACKVAWNIEYRKPVIGESTSGSFALSRAQEIHGPNLESFGVSRPEFYSTTIHDMDAEWIPFIRFYEEKTAIGDEARDFDAGVYGKYDPPAPPNPSAPSAPLDPSR